EASRMDAGATGHYSCRMPRKRTPSRRRVTRTRKTEPTLPRPPRANSGLAPEMQNVNAYLAVANVSASIGFLERALGFTRGVVLAGPDGQPRYAEMRHGQSVVMLVPRGDS